MAVDHDAGCSDHPDRIMVNKVIDTATRKALEKYSSVTNISIKFNVLNETSEYIAVEDEDYTLVDEGDRQKIQTHNDLYIEIFGEDPPRTGYGPIVILYKS